MVHCIQFDYVMTIHRHAKSEILHTIIILICCKLLPIHSTMFDDRVEMARGGTHCRGVLIVAKRKDMLHHLFESSMTNMR